MKKRRSFVKPGNFKNPLEDLDNERYIELLENGLSDEEIAREFDIDNSYLKRLRDEWREDY
ncbi:helix-turn-helix domain-containing protein [Fonticella tunisiensis]|uniref:Homeodomain-like domain-containing protein n=1 Tax=Fonticella tunisiensis TaxID=1096341 RepID=A0A4R7K463_9CLOT|nr:helix-turn-helix domain-containing protein [Fonticella tunisiensis]TDT45975.1 hypothetical protein EDD71_1448 [Fonticella tunisiensis]